MKPDADADLAEPMQPDADLAGEPAARRRMKGRQIVTALYLPPETYWAFKDFSAQRGMPMQRLLRQAIHDYLARESLGLSPTVLH